MSKGSAGEGVQAGVLSHIGHGFAVVGPEDDSHAVTGRRGGAILDQTLEEDGFVLLGLVIQNDQLHLPLVGVFGRAVEHVHKQGHRANRGIAHVVCCDRSSGGAGCRQVARFLSHLRGNNRAFHHAHSFRVADLVHDGRRTAGAQQRGKNKGGKNTKAAHTSTKLCEGDKLYRRKCSFFESRSSSSKTG